MFLGFRAILFCDKGRFGFLKNEKEFLFELLKQVLKFNLIIIRGNLPTYQYEES
jgi:hypothetical protein